MVSIKGIYHVKLYNILRIRNQFLSLCISLLHTGTIALDERIPVRFANWTTFIAVFSPLACVVFVSTTFFHACFVGTHGPDVVGSSGCTLTKQVHLDIVGTRVTVLRVAIFSCLECTCTSFTSFVRTRWHWGEHERRHSWLNGFFKVIL